ncbi:MAG: hypothetical protein ACXVYY_16305 [Oryzihumus sp.]
MRSTWGRAGRRREAWVPVVLFLMLAVVYCATSTRGVASTDDHAPAVEAWRIASAGTPWLEDALPNPTVEKNPWLHEVPNGHVVADRMAGPVIISVPAYLLLDRDPVRFSLVPGGIAAAIMTAGTGCLMFLALRRRLGDPTALVVTLAFALATPTWAISADGPWTHTLTQLGIAGAAYGASRNRYLVAGAFLGVGMLGRPHLALVALVLGLGMVWSTRSLRPAVAVALPTSLTLAVLLVWNHWMFGVWAVTSAGYVGHGLAAVGGRPPLDASMAGWGGHLLNYLGFLVAPDRGLLVWTPVLLVMVPAVRRRWSVLPAWSRWLPAGALAYTVLQLQMNAFHGGDSFYGYRIPLELVTALTPLVGFAVPALTPRGRVTATCVVALQFAAVSVGSVTAALFVTAQRVWVDNAFWMAVRGLPVPMLTWTALCVLAGLVLLRRATSRPTTATPGVGGYRRDLQTHD